MHQDCDSVVKLDFVVASVGERLERSSPTGSIHSVSLHQEEKCGSAALCAAVLFCLAGGRP